MFVNIILHSIWIQVFYEPLITFLGSSNVMGFMKMITAPAFWYGAFLLAAILSTASPSRVRPANRLVPVLR